MDFPNIEKDLLGDIISGASVAQRVSNTLEDAGSANIRGNELNIASASGKFSPDCGINRSKFVKSII
jgi:hypothetical protein